MIDIEKPPAPPTICRYNATAYDDLGILGLGFGRDERRRVRGEIVTFLANLLLWIGGVVWYPVQLACANSYVTIFYHETSFFFFAFRHGCGMVLFASLCSNYPATILSNL